MTTFNNVVQQLNREICEIIMRWRRRRRWRWCYTSNTHVCIWPWSTINIKLMMLIPMPMIQWEEYPQPFSFEHTLSIHFPHTTGRHRQRIKSLVVNSKKYLIVFKVIYWGRLCSSLFMHISYHHWTNHWTKQVVSKVVEERETCVVIFLFAVRTYDFYSYILLKYMYIRCWKWMKNIYIHTIYTYITRHSRRSREIVKLENSFIIMFLLPLFPPHSIHFHWQ